MNTENEIRQEHKHRSMEKVSYAEKGRFFKIRNILNFIFIILAIVGMVIYIWNCVPAHQVVGGITLVAAVFIKLTECFLRILH